MPINSGFSGVQLPRVCGRENDDAAQDKECPLDPYTIVHEKSKFVDQQVLKLQEAPDAVPVGELPRQIQLVVDRYLCARVTAGSRISLVGSYSIYQQKAKNADTAIAVRRAYVRVLGIELDATAQAGRASGTNTTVFTAEEENQFIEMSRRPHVFKTFCESIAPSIYGNTEMEKVLACLLVGGT